MIYNYRLIKNITNLLGAGFMVLGSITASAVTSPILELSPLEDDTVQLWNKEPIIPVTGIPGENNAFISPDFFTEGGCTMTTTGEVFCWGGIADAGVTGAVVGDMLASGEGHACTMKAEGLVCWGSNAFGQLGDGSWNNNDKETLVTGLGQNVIGLAAGAAHTCVVMADDSIACWGSNAYGQLGNNTTNDSSNPIATQ
jgi:hypothetical protein